MELNRVFYFCKLLYMFRVGPPPIIRSIKLYLQHIAVGNSNSLTNTICCRYSFVLLVMGGGPTRNM